MICPACEVPMSPEWEDPVRERGAYWLCVGCGHKEPPTFDDWKEVYYLEKHAPIEQPRPSNRRNKRTLSPMEQKMLRWQRSRSLRGRMWLFEG